MNVVALIMAGGRSERMRAGNCKTHKALRTVAEKSLLLHNLESIVSFGFKDIYIAVSAGEEQLLSYVRNLAVSPDAKGASISTLIEPRPFGTIGAARLLLPVATNVIVTNVDNLTTLNLRAMLDHHLNARAALTVASHRESFRIPFGQLEVTDGKVLAYAEKPRIPVRISSGSYILSPRALSSIQPHARINAPDLINALIESGELVSCFDHQSWWIDVNDEAALASAEEIFGPLRALAAATG